MVLIVFSVTGCPFGAQACIRLCRQGGNLGDLVIFKEAFLAELQGSLPAFMVTPPPPGCVSLTAAHCLVPMASCLESRLELLAAFGLSAGVEFGARLRHSTSSAALGLLDVLRCFTGFRTIGKLRLP